VKRRRILAKPSRKKKEDLLKTLVQSGSVPKKPHGFAVPNFATEKQMMCALSIIRRSWQRQRRRLLMWQCPTQRTATKSLSIAEARFQTSTANVGAVSRDHRPQVPSTVLRVQQGHPPKRQPRSGRLNRSAARPMSGTKSVWSAPKAMSSVTKTPRSQNQNAMRKKERKPGKSDKKGWEKCHHLPQR